MANLNLYLFISIIIPLVMLLVLVKGKSRRLVLFFILGIVTCLFCGELNGILINLFHSVKYYTVNISPIIEEIFKAFPIIVYAFLYKPDLDELLQCGVSIGIGFAVLENAFILASNIEYITVGFAVARGMGAGIMHGLCSGAVSYGMSYIKSKKKLFYTGTLTFLSIAIVYHSIYNCLVQSKFTWVAYLLTIGTALIIIIKMNLSKIRVKEKR